MADTQVRGMNSRNSAADDNEIFMITVQKLGHWSSTERDNGRKKYRKLNAK